MYIKYRPEIDGLRAVAVISVILYHAKLNLLGSEIFRGGFIGVDIFFVISGYLITSIIFKEILTTGNFSFQYFYERRIRRIIPALLVVILGSLPLAWIIIMPVNFIDFSKSILFSLGFSSNFYFHYSGQGYGEISGLLKPFLHTWSLSVEEQYYIIFPIILILTLKYFQKYLIHILLVSFFISLVLASWGSKNHPSFNFYILPTRGWELLAGSILAYFQIYKNKIPQNNFFKKFFPLLGIILIFHSILFFDDEMLHPSFFTLSPIVGVCLIIWFSNTDEIITRILSTKLFVSIGLISYSLYLWHYPLFAFLRISEFELNNYKVIFFVIIMLSTLSILSYFLVEKVSRNKKYKFRHIGIPILIVITTIAIFCFFGVKTLGYKDRLPQELKIENIDNRFEEKNLAHFKKCHQKIMNLQNFCLFGNFDRNVYLVGDSHTDTLAFNLKERLNLINYNFINMSAPAGIYGRNRIIDGIDTNKLDKRREIILNKIKDSTVIFGGWIHREKDWFFNDNRSKYAKLFNILEKNNNKIIILYPIPSVDPKYNMNLIRHYKKNRNLPDIFIDRKIFEEQTKKSYKFYDSFKNSNIFKIYPAEVSCDQNKCYSIKDNSILMVDYSHPSSIFAYAINSEIIKLLK